LTEKRKFGVGRGRVFPADRAQSLLNPLRRFVQSPSRTVATMMLEPDSRVLEVGCGPGFFSPFLARAAPIGQLVLVDLQIGMLRTARGRLPAGSNAGCVRADASALPLATATFDAVICATMLGEVPDTAGCLDEIRRVLRPGGRLTVAETRRDSDFIAFHPLRALVEGHGFALEERRGIAWQYVARFRRT